MKIEVSKTQMGDLTFIDSVCVLKVNKKSIVYYFIALLVSRTILTILCRTINHKDVDVMVFQHQKNLRFLLLLYISRQKKRLRI